MQVCKCITGWSGEEKVTLYVPGVALSSRLSNVACWVSEEVVAVVPPKTVPALFSGSCTEI